VTVQKLVEAHGHRADYDFPQLRQDVSDAIEGSSFRDIAERGSGLPEEITREQTHVSLQNAVVLELVHLTDIGVSAMTLEGVRQDRERSIFLDRVSHISSSQEGLSLRELDWLRPDLQAYPRRRLKLFLSDGTTELQAVELERLSNIELGSTPMGTKASAGWHLSDDAFF
jgi:RecQ-mediated genome instability protein 1